MEDYITEHVSGEKAAPCSSLFL